MTILEMLKFSDKLARMSREEIVNMLNAKCNNCVARHVGNTPCDRHECHFERLCREEIEFRNEMTKLLK